MSFTIPLASAPGEAHSHLILFEEGEGEAKESPAITGGECKGTYQHPAAASGNGAGKTGATLIFEVPTTGTVVARGTWVVTA